MFFFDVVLEEEQTRRWVLYYTLRNAVLFPGVVRVGVGVDRKL